jgi:hypothetical protein
VITSWQVYTDRAGPEATVQLRVLAQEVGGKFALVGGGPISPVPEMPTTSGPTLRNVQHVFATRVPISTGQMVGTAFAHAAGSYIYWVRSFETGFNEGCFGTFCGAGKAVPPDGQPTEPFISSNTYLAMNATLEPDTDRDGYGDETQDACIGTCPGPQITVDSTTKTKKKCKKGKRLKHGKCVKKKKHHPRKKGKGSKH